MAKLQRKKNNYRGCQHPSLQLTAVTRVFSPSNQYVRLFPYLVCLFDAEQQATMGDGHLFTPMRTMEPEEPKAIEDPQVQDVEEG